MQHRGSPLDGVWELVLCLWLLMGGYVGVCAREALRSRYNIRYKLAVLNLAAAMWAGVSLIIGTIAPATPYSIFYVGMAAAEQLLWLSLAAGALIFGWLWLAGTHYSRLREYSDQSTASSGCSSRSSEFFWRAPGSSTDEPTNTLLPASSRSARPIPWGGPSRIYAQIHPSNRLHIRFLFGIM